MKMGIEQTKSYSGITVDLEAAQSSADDSPGVSNLRETIQVVMDMLKPLSRK